MVALAEQLAERLSSLYARAGDVSAASFVQSCREALSDESALAELIDTDGRLRLERGLPVELSRYLDAIPDLATRPVALDAAIEFTLRSLAGPGAPAAAAVERLIAQYPQFQAAIRASSLLTGALWSTSQVQGESAPPPTLNLPQDFGPELPGGRARFELRELLGRGAHGAVYLAADRHLSDPGRPAWVAIKVLPDDPTGASRDRLTEEATRARRINHPNVARVLDRGSTPAGADYIVYEYVDGTNLRQWLDARSSPIPLRGAAELVAKIARGVQAAHAVGVVHCDIKPDNILLTRSGEPKLGDFGLAVRLEDGAGEAQRGSGGGPIGNLAFIAPEQFRMEDGAFAVPADIYALGGILFYLLTRALPNGQSVAEAERNLDPATARTEPPSVRSLRPGVDADLEAICRRALGVRPADRYGSAESLANDLEAWAAFRPLPWTAPSRRRLLRLFARREPLAVAILCALLLAMAGAGALTVYLQTSAKRRLYEQKMADARRLEAETAAWYKRHNQDLDELANVIKTGLSHYGKEEWLAVLTVVESTTGPKLLDDKGWSAVWQERVRRMRAIIDEDRADGHGDDLEPRIWQASLGFWLLKHHEYEAAESELAACHDALAKQLAPTDRWLLAIDHLRQCATLQQWMDPARRVDDEAGRAARVRAIATSLEASASEYTGRRQRGGIRRLILQCLLDAYTSPYLADRAGKLRIEKMLQELDS